MRLVLAAVAAALVTPAWAPVCAMAAPPGQMTALYANAARNGNVAGAGIGEHPARAWSRAGGWDVPIVADRHIFALLWPPSDAPAELHAIDQGTGRSDWSVTFRGVSPFAPAYDDGKLFVQLGDGHLVAYDAATGRQLWSTELTGQSNWDQPAVAGDGEVFSIGTGTGETFYAVNEETGQVTWTGYDGGGGDGPLSYSAGRVYANLSGPQIFAFDARTGADAWHYGGPESGGGGYVAPVYDGKLYARQNYNGGPGYVLDAASGGYLGGFGADFAPIFDAGSGIFFTNSDTRAVNLANGQTVWRKPVAEQTQRPLAADGVVWTCADYDLVGLRITDGARVFAQPASEPSASGGCSIGAGQGTLVVAWDGRMTAYRSADATAPTSPSSGSAIPPAPAPASSAPRLHLVVPVRIRLKELRRRGLPIELKRVQRKWKIEVKLIRVRGRRIAALRARTLGTKWRARLRPRIAAAPTRPLKAVLRVRVLNSAGAALHASRRVKVVR